MKNEGTIETLEKGLLCLHFSRQLYYDRQSSGLGYCPYLEILSVVQGEVFGCKVDEGGL